MPQPAFPHQQQARTRLEGNERATSRRSRHHQRQARVLKADRSRTGGDFDVKRTRDGAVRMDVSTVVPTGSQQIDPQAVEARLARKIERAFRREFGRVPREKPRHIGECRIPLRQIVQRGVAGVTGIALLFRPADAARIVLRKRAYRARQVVQQCIIAKLAVVKLRYKQVAHHYSSVSRAAAARKLH